MESENTFSNLGLTEATLKVLEKKGFEKPTPIQEKTIPIILNTDLNLIGQAQTGTGKTAAFGLPVIEKIDNGGNHVKVLILSPTRELAIQVSDEMNTFVGSRKLRVATLYGGASIGEQLRRLRKGVDIVVGTPGRLLDHIRRGSLMLGKLDFLILDEADEMLNMGFVEDIEEIMSKTPESKRTLLFSATMPEQIKRMVKKYIPEYEMIAVKNKTLTTDLTSQIYFEVRRTEKFDALSRIIDVERDFYGIVFCRTRLDVDEVNEKLLSRGYSADGLHGDISQSGREKIYARFKKKRINILVATDVAARGLDVQDLTHVINYSIPQDPEAYIHRIGRTGRAGKQGTAITFITPGEYRQFTQIQRIAKTKIEKQELPKVEELLGIKKDSILAELSIISEKEVGDNYLNLASSLLENSDPQIVIANLIKKAYNDELNENNYQELAKKRNINVDKAGTTRLFVGLGKKDDMTPPKLVKFIRENVKLRDSNIDKVQVFDEFSFVTVPFSEAEELLQIFKTKGKGRKPLIEKAQKTTGRSKPRDKSNDRYKDKYKDKSRSKSRDRRDKFKR